MNEKIVQLPPIKESIDDFDQVEKRIKDLFKKYIYLPLMKELSLNGKALTNSKDDLLKAIQSGRITFNRGTFSGRFNSTLSRELRNMGAKWDRRQGSFKIPLSKLPADFKSAISISSARFADKLKKLDETLASVIPEELAKNLKVEKLFDQTLWKTERDFQASVKGITIAPKLTTEQSRRIAAEWQNNLELYIVDWSDKEIKKLRSEMRETIFAGDRYGSVIDSIVKSYGVSQNKAKFLARQETSLLMTKYKQTRYEEAGIDEYYWHHVLGTAAHPVRLIHRALGDAKEKDGTKKIYRWSDPPIVGPQGNRKNPGQDYNCRCTAIPIVRFRK